MFGAKSLGHAPMNVWVAFCAAGAAWALGPKARPAFVVRASAQWWICWWKERVWKVCPQSIWSQSEKYFMGNESSCKNIL